MTTPVLNHTRVSASDRDPERWFLMLHGVYGTGRNWATIARRVVEARPQWGALLVDLRLHGGSQSFPPPHTLAACAADVDRLVDELDLQATAVVGHSFGGKVALLYAQHHGDELSQAWIVESTPAAREPPAGSAWKMLEVLRSLPPEFGSRQQAVEALERSGGLATGVAQWMAMNLDALDDGRFRWRLDLDGIEQMLRDFFSTELWGVVEAPPGDLELYVVKGSQSDTLDPVAAARVEAAGVSTGRVHLHHVHGGHWLNADNPDALVELMTTHLP